MERKWLTVFRVKETIHIPFSTPSDFQSGQHIAWIEDYNGNEYLEAKQIKNIFIIGSWSKIDGEAKTLWRQKIFPKCTFVGRKLQRNYNHEL
jgi:hypothetical protein